MTSKWITLFLLVLTTGCAQPGVKNHSGQALPAEQKSISNETSRTASSTNRAELIRTDCIAGRRIICGRVLQVTLDGLVVDSGYVDLLRPALSQSWVVPANVAASRDPNVLELKTPGTPCIGLVFLTNIPKRPKVANYDYVAITAYPAGEYIYSPAPNVQKTIRKFSASLAIAVKLNLQSLD